MYNYSPYFVIFRKTSRSLRTVELKIARLNRTMNSRDFAPCKNALITTIYRWKEKMGNKLSERSFMRLIATLAFFQTDKSETWLEKSTIRYFVEIGRFPLTGNRQCSTCSRQSKFNRWKCKTIVNYSLTSTMFHWFFIGSSFERTNTSSSSSFPLMSKLANETHYNKLY